MSKTFHKEDMMSNDASFALGMKMISSPRFAAQTVLQTGFQTTQIRQLTGGLQPMLLVHASCPQTPEETNEG